MTKLLFVSHSAGMLGAERSLLEIARDAVDRGYEVVVGVPGEGPLVTALESLGARCHRAPMRSWMGPRHRIVPLGLVRLTQVALSTRQHVRMLKECQPDIVITNSSTIPAAAWAARRLGYPHVWIVRESLLTNRELRSLVPKSWIVRQIAEHSAAVCAVSDYIKGQLNSVVAEDLLHVWPVRPKPRAPLSTDPRPNKDAGILRLLLAGYVSKEKGHFLVLSAMRQLKLGSEGVTLQIVGRGRVPVVAVLRLIIRISGLRNRVQLTGWVDDMSAAYGNADSLLMASKNEAFGRTTVEALTAGIPVLGLDSGGTSELLQPGGGRLVSPPTASGLAKAIDEWAQLDARDWSALLQEAQVRGQQLLRGPTQFAYVERAIKSALDPATGSHSRLVDRSTIAERVRRWWRD
jgi:glycosyltransferase involved in cell wall biosynthesis